MPGKNTTYPGDRGAPALGRGVEPAHLERRRVRASCSSCPTVLIAVCDRAHALVVSTQRDRPRPVVSSFLLLFVHGCALWFPKVLRGDPARLQVLQRSHVLRQGGPAGCRTTAKSSLHLDKLKDWPLKRKSEGLPFRRPSGDCFFACFKTRPPGESVARPGRPIRVQGGRRDGDSADACAAIHGRGGGELHRGAAILLLLVPLSTSSPACASAWAAGRGRSAMRRGTGGGGVSAVLRRPRAVQRVGLPPRAEASCPGRSGTRLWPSWWGRIVPRSRRTTSARWCTTAPRSRTAGTGCTPASTTPRVWVASVGTRPPAAAEPPGQRGARLLRRTG